MRPIPVEDQSKTVCEYVNTNREWKWNSFASYLPNEILLSIAAMRRPCDEDGEDSMIWGASQTGKFTIKSAFELVERHRWEEEHPKWKAVWKWSGSERVKTFLWLAMKEKLLTNTERARRHMCDSTTCNHCHMEPETVLHVLRDCRYATQVWMGLVSPDRWSEFFSLPVQEWLYSNLTNNLSFDLSMEWSLIFGVACWLLWQWRNKALFDDAFCEMSNPIGFIKFKAKQFSHSTQFNDDEQSRRTKQSRLIGWDAPPMGWIKVNSDGARKSSSGLASAGGLLRDDQGRWVTGFAVNLGRCSALMAEIWGAWYALNLTWEKNIKKLILEMDSLAAVQIFSKANNNATIFHGLVLDIRRMLSLDW